MIIVWRYLLSYGLLLPLLACTAVSLHPPHPFEAQLEGQWYYECRYYDLDEGLPVSVDGYAIYLEGRSHERLDVAVGTDCSEAGRILTMRFEGTYTLGDPVRVKLDDRVVEAVRDDEVKQKITYELTPTFASAVGDDAACKSLLGQGVMDGSVAALAQCAITRDFRELEDRTRHQRTVLYVERCRLFNGDEEAGKDAGRYPTALDTDFWGVKYCPKDR